MKPPKKRMKVAAAQDGAEADDQADRIAKVLARAGLCSRRDAERWITEGRVAINGKTLTSPAVNVGPNDQVEVDGRPLPQKERTRLWLYHKPRGLVTTARDPEGRPTVFESLPENLPRVIAVGRLDINTEGLLLLTNDGGLARVLELPSTGWLRRYRVRAWGSEVLQPDLDKLKDGVTIEGVMYGAIEWQSVAQIRISTVPTELQRQGIFTETVGGKTLQIFDPATTAGAPGGEFTRDQFADSTILQSRIDPVARGLLGHYPLPNLPGTVNNYRRVATEQTTQNQFDVRLDHRFSSRSLSFGRYSQAGETVDPATPFPDGGGALTSGTIAPSGTHGQSAVAHFTRSFGASVVSDTGFGYTRRSLHRRSASLDNSPAADLNLPGIPGDTAFQNAFPTFTISGFQQLGPPADANSELRTDVTEITHATSFQLGRHTMKAGLDWRWERLDILEPPSPTGQFQFTSLFTDLPGAPGTGFALASFLLGQVNQFSIDLQQKTLRPRAHIQEYFLQDDWKVTPRLTVNAGLRYTLNFPSTEANDQAAVFNLDTQKLEYLGKDGAPRAARKLHKHDFGPRVGFACRIGEKTVVRSGYGLVWIEMAGITTPFTTPQFPFLQSVSQRTLDNVAPAFVLADGPSVTPLPLTPDAGLGQGVFSVNRDLTSGYAQQWNLAIQREVRPNLSFEIAYAGNKITHLGVPDTNLNQLTEDQLKLGPALLARVPNPFYGEIPRSSSLGDPTIPQAQLLKPYPRFTTVSLYRNNVGNSIYHALQAKLQQRFSNGLGFLVSYTRSKLIDDASSVFNASILTGPVANFPVADSFNRRRERDVSTGDIPNVFVASYTYELPWGTGRRFGMHGSMDKLLGGWEMNGIVTLQSGTPVAVTQATNFNAFAGFGTQRPNLVGDPALPADRRSTSQWFNTEAFAVAPQFTLGSSGRNPVRGPGYRNWDLALIKRTPVSERVSTEFRVEMFNVTNTPPLGAPAAVLGDAGFGSIRSAADPRLVQLGTKILF